MEKLNDHLQLIKNSYQTWILSKKIITSQFVLAFN